MNKEQIRAVLAAALKSKQTTMVRFHKTRIPWSKQLAITQKLRYPK